MTDDPGTAIFDGIMLMKKKVFVLNIGNYRPDLLEYTLPTIRFYAAKIGAEFELITDRKFPEWPITYEKMQVYNRGWGASWNIFVDADFMLHPDLPDFTRMIDPSMVGFHWGFDMRTQFKENIYFRRCGHFQAIASGFVVSSNLTHDLWKPLKIHHKQALEQTKRAFIIDEYTLTLNLAKYGLKYTGLEFSEQIKNQMIHIGNEEKTDEERVQDCERAKKLFEQWGL